MADVYLVRAATSYKMQTSMVVLLHVIILQHVGHILKWLLLNNYSHSFSRPTVVSKPCLCDKK